MIGLGVVRLCTAQKSDPWDRLRTIQWSAKVEARDSAGKRIADAFEQATADSIQVRTEKGIVSTAKADVASVSLLMGINNRGQNWEEKSILKKAPPNKEKRRTEAVGKVASPPSPPPRPSYAKASANSPRERLGVPTRHSEA